MPGSIAPRAPNPPDATVAPATPSEMLVPESELGAGGAVGKYRRPSAKPPERPTAWAVVVNSPVRVLWNTLFLITVLVPTVISAIYFGLIASDVYMSESRFVVRTPQRAQQPGLVGALLQGTGFQRAQDDSFTVHDFISSRDALQALDEKLGVRSAYADPSIDFLSRFPQPWVDDSFESLFKHYTNHITVNYDANASITTVQVRAYSAEMAYQINAALLGMGESLVNQINDRGRLDLIKYATADVAEAESKAKTAAIALASYRNRRAVFDPDRQSALQLQQVTKLQDELIATKLQLAQLRALSPVNPQIGSLERRVKGLETEMGSEMAKVAGGGNSFTDKAGEFERLQLERTFADRQVASALSNLEAARSEARRKQLYLERIVQPHKPDYALEPRRLRAVLATFAFGLVAWGVLSMLLAGVREHRE